jgi:uncharacterized membrane protein YgcG
MLSRLSNSVRWLHFSAQLARWNMTDLYDALENCLRALEAGAELDSVLSRYPNLANELRPILEASIVARSMAGAAPPPSAEAMRRGRARLLQHAAELKEGKTRPRRRVIPAFQRLGLALAVALVFLLSGTGLVSASSTALPGEKLYPVKRTWEDVRLLFVFNTMRREALRSEYENERLDEVDDLLSEGRDESIQFAGVFMDVNGIAYISGIRVIIQNTTLLPSGGVQNGDAVIVTGRTNAQGFVEVESVETLPAGTVVPVGNPVIEETEEHEGQGAGSNVGSTAVPTPGREAEGSATPSGSTSNIEPDARNFQLEGTVESRSDGTLVVDGRTVYLSQPETLNIVPGMKVKLEGYFASDGRFIVTKIEVEESHLDRNNDNEGGDSNGGDQNDHEGEEGDHGSGGGHDSGDGGGDHEDKP